MTIPESPIIQIERSKAIALFASVFILAAALFAGLLNVGWGISSRTDSGIVVTGSARTEAVADNAVWTLSLFRYLVQRLLTQLPKWAAMLRQ